MKYIIQNIQIANTICNQCGEEFTNEKPITIIVIAQSDLGTTSTCVCGDCSVNMKIGQELK